MRSFFKLSILTAMLLLVAASLFGQGTTGSLQGTVTQDGTALPGVTVTATSPNLQGERQAVTNESGGYAIGNIPPGPYTVRFELTGLQTVTKQQHVGVTQSVTLNADMKVSAVAEAITVTAAAPAVAETKEVQANFTNELIDELPMARTVTAITRLAPGVVEGVNGPSISGGFSFDNLYTVNGAVIQENLRGQPHNLFIEDAVQETTVQVAGISAEFGNFTGGVVNAITKSGGNEFSGSLRDSFLNPAWTTQSPTIWRATPSTTDDPFNIEQVDQTKNKSKLNQTWEATLGGRIIRDRLWFFAAGRDVEVDAERVFGGANSNRYIDLRSERRLEGKLTASVTSRHSLVGSVLEAPVEHQNECQVVGCFDADGLIPSSARDAGFETLTYNGVITNNFLVEGRWSHKYFTFIDVGGTDHDRVTGTPVRVYGTGGGRATNESYFCGDCTPEERNNDAYAAKLTYYLGTRGMGTHNLTAGYDHWHETRLSNNYQSPTDFVFIANARGSSAFNPSHVNGQTSISVRGGTIAADGTCTTCDYIIHFPILAQSLGSDLNTDSLWFNDRWDLTSRWTLNLGVRYDKNDSLDSIGNSVADDSKFSPRLGVTFDTFGNGRLRLNASYGVYAGRLAETIAGLGSAAGNPATFAYYYGGSDIMNVSPSEAMRQVWAWYDSKGGVEKVGAWSVNVPGTQRQIPESLVSPNVAEFSFGAATQLGAAFLRADVIHRDWQDFYASERNLGIGTITLPNGTIADKEFVRNTNEMNREYLGITLQGAYRLLNRIQLGGNYTWSELTGNASLESVGSVVVTEAAGNYYPEYYNFDRNNPDGFLPGDSTHKLRAWAAVDFPTFLGNFNVSVLQSFDSGTPYSLAAGIDIRSSANFYGTGLPGGVTNPGYRTPPTSLNYFFSDRGEFRYNDVMSTSLALNYDTNPSWLRGVSLFVQAEVLNVFDEDANTFNTSVLTGTSCTPACTRFNPFAGDTPVEGTHWQKGPLFGKPTEQTIPVLGVDGVSFGGSFQTPRTYRGSVGLRF
jgi:outer membrane receptor protein involved in Fe transport